jgi:hypothetical protein
VKPANQEGPGGNCRNNGYLPLSFGMGDVRPSNLGWGGDRRGGSNPLGGSASPVVPPNHRFDVGLAKMPQPESAVEPGKGAVPVNPWDSMGQPAKSMPTADMPRTK